MIPGPTMISRPSMCWGKARPWNRNNSMRHDARREAREFEVMEYRIVPSVCSYCGTGCGVLFEVLDGRLVRTLPMKTHPVNEGKTLHQGLEPA